MANKPAGTDRARTEVHPPEKLLQQSERARLWRFTQAGGRLIRKEVLGSGWEARLRHEQAILERLSGIRGVPRIRYSPPYPRSIILGDIPGEPLRAARLPLSVVDLVALAVRLVQVVAEVHGQGVIHRAINPTTILVSDDREDLHLVEFSLATASAEIRPEFTHPNEITGRLPYLAPEETGRTGRQVDQRADLYSLGATLYELATGAPPFGGGDPLRLSHDHLARTPPAPRDLNPAVPAALSEIIMRLLEKEPDNRYQTAEGAGHDLRHLADGVALELGTRDVPARLLPPTRAVGRDGEIATLRAAFQQAVSGQAGGVLVSGPPGVGKTSLVDQLRPVVTAAGGWFVTGKFDRYRRDLETDAVRHAFQELARLLLAEPEEKLAQLRPRMLQGLGADAGLVVTVVPALAPLLKIAPEAAPGDPLTLQARLARTALAMLREIASPQRPVVFALDDLQWAGRTPLNALDVILHEQSESGELDGLLLVGSYRDDQLDPAHPLATLLERWREDRLPLTQITLDNLTSTGLTTLVSEMLRLPREQAAELADAIAPHTAGNPYETVELLNSMRREGALLPDPGGWRWEARQLRGWLGRTDVAQLLAERASATPPATQLLLQTMACLGGRADLTLLQAATGLPIPRLEEQLTPALHDRLLTMEPGRRPEVRFRHDRVQEAVLGGLGQAAERTLRLRMARRLAQRPELVEIAAEQFLPVVDALQAPSERRRVANLFRRAADQARLLSDHTTVEKQLAAAVQLTEPTEAASLIRLQTGRHEALYSLGRLAEADQVFHAIERLRPSPAERLAAASVQVCSLTNRNRSPEAVQLGLRLLRELGFDTPPDSSGARPPAATATPDLGLLYRWLDEDDWDGDLSRPEVTDRGLLATGTLIARLMAPAFFCDQAALAWLTLEAVRLWAEHGPCRTLIGPIGHVPFVAISLRQDYQAGHRALRRVLAVGERRGFEPDTSEARFLYGIGVGHWVEPLEDLTPHVKRARQGLLHGGNLQKACHTYYVSAYAMLETEPSLDALTAELDAGRSFAARTRNHETVKTLGPYRRLVARLRGEPVSEPAPESGNTNVTINRHITAALAAAIFGDRPALAEHTSAIAPLLPAVPGVYPTALGHFLRALALADQGRPGGPDRSTEVLAALDTERDWLAERATDAPANFLHLLRLVEAERAAVAGDMAAAIRSFDLAYRGAGARTRPWHQALIAERAAAFYLAHGGQHPGQALLREARQAYLAWGATAKVEQLEQAHPQLAGAPGLAGAGGGAPTATGGDLLSGTIDLLGVLAASQALSSETDLAGLSGRVAEVLSAMTGATGVHLLLREESGSGWRLLECTGDAPVPLSEAIRRRLVPASAVRYVERTAEPLVVADATRDDRFARDPYLAELDPCALLVLPIVNRGTLQAMVVLENRLIRGAFHAGRLDAVRLIGGQLAVSLDNATVYSSLERKVAERTDELAQANRRLARLSVTDPLTGLANRRSLEEVLATEWRRALRAGRALALAMVDIDHFKLYNDHYGHGPGDRCLQGIARVLRDQVRETELVARFGGEEFAVVLPDTELTSALRVAERLRVAVLELAEPNPAAPERVVTASVGVAGVIPGPDWTVERLMEQADAELYHAKREGRNLVRPARSI